MGVGGSQINSFPLPLASPQPGPIIDKYFTLSVEYLTIIHRSGGK